MKGIILAGGTGSRLGPLSRVTNKHLLPIGPAPMIYYPISQLICNNIDDICIVSGINHLGSVVSLLGSGKQFSCKFTYKVQDNPGGIGEALSLCRDFSGNKNIVVLLGDNIFGEVIDLSSPLNNCAVLFLKNVSDPHRFGIAEVDHMKKLIDIEEKPENPKSNLAITGVYIYRKEIWEALDNISISKRNELEISDANKWILTKYGIETREVCGWWSDAGTQESFKKSNEMVWGNLDNRINNIIYKMIKI